MESYNAKGKLTGRNHQQVTSFTSSGNNYAAKIHTVMYDAKDKETMQGDLNFTCQNGTMLIDMRNLVSEEQLKAFQSYQMKLESENLEVPTSLSAGQSLKDGTMSISTVDSPIPMTMDITVTDRKVVGKESITTPAGTFDCYKITSNLTVKTKMAIGFTLTMSSVEWLAPKVAVVKSESYNKNGKLQGYTILTKHN